MSSSEDEYDPAGALDDIESTLDTLEDLLGPLLSGKMTWDELMEKESADHMGRAKLNMMMAFGVCDLLFGESSSGPEISAWWIRGSTDEEELPARFSVFTNEGT